MKTNPLTTHSFRHLTNFYEMTVKNSNDIDIKQSADILKERFLLIDEAKSLENQFLEMLENQKE